MYCEWNKELKGCCPKPKPLPGWSLGESRLIIGGIFFFFICNEIIMYNTGTSSNVAVEEISPISWAKALDP